MNTNHASHYVVVITMSTDKSVIILNFDDLTKLLLVVNNAMQQ